MPLLTVEGMYRDGKIELSERPDDIETASRVLVTFLPPANSSAKAEEELARDKEARRQQAFAQMKEGLHLGGPPYPRREELHDRYDG